MSTDTPSAGASRPQPIGPLGQSPPQGRTAREIALTAEIAALEAELDRRERRHRHTVESYETLLEDQARAGREADAFDWTQGEHDGTTDRERSGLLARLRARFPLR